MTDLHDVDLGIEKNGTAQVPDDHFRSNFVRHLHHGRSKFVGEKLDLKKYLGLVQLRNYYCTATHIEPWRSHFKYVHSSSVVTAYRKCP